MTGQDWAWLGFTFLQVTGLAVALAALGFGYDRAIRDRANLLFVIERDSLVRWLAVGIGIFSIGLWLGEANWIQRLAAAGITLLLGWMAWQSRK